MVSFSGSDIFLFFVGFFLPPLAVVLKAGCGVEFLISIGLTLLGHIPGIAYAWYVIYKNRDEPEHVRHYGRTYSAIPSHQHLPEGHYHVAPADQHVAGAHVHVDPAHTQ